MAAGPGRVALMSIHPRYADGILAGTKQVEFRKRRLAPDVDTVIVYATQPIGAVVGVVRLAGTDIDTPQRLWHRHGRHGDVERRDYDQYYAHHQTAVGLCVSHARRLNTPLSLTAVGATVAPQSFQYLPLAVLDQLDDPRSSNPLMPVSWTQSPPGSWAT